LPLPRGDGVYNRLTAGMDVDMLYPDVLLPFAAMTLECLDLSSEGAQQLHCEVPIPLPKANMKRACSTGEPNCITSGLLGFEISFSFGARR